MQLPPIAATTIGSFPRPNWLAQPDRARVIFRHRRARFLRARRLQRCLSTHPTSESGFHIKYIDLDEQKVFDPTPAIQLIKETLGELGK
jgi:hypothetical protein